MEFYKDNKNNLLISESTDEDAGELSAHKAYKDLSQAILNSLDLKTIKTSHVLLALQNRGLHLNDLHKVLFWPREMNSSLNTTSRMTTAVMLNRNWVQPLLKEIRADFSYAEMASILNVQSLATFHHWESGRRDIPFHFFLLIIDKIQGRLQAFIDNLPVQIDLAHIELLNLKPKLYQQFFSVPWLPTVLLALGLRPLKEKTSITSQAEYLAEKLKMPKASIEFAIETLLHLQLLKIEEGRLVSQPHQFYAIPAITDEKIKELQNYWFSQSQDLLANPGFHRFEQHTTTRESKEKIIGWITELREKIKEEVKSSGEPETLIHISWQMAELL